ncbi:MAG: ATP synthase F1 subunit delta [Fibrobacteres bacterium]|nr:ATP synthase F1 subunit delta [Fibrobacterota bacterium]
MSYGRIAARYATALMKYAEEQNIVDKLVFDIDQIRTVGDGSPEFVSFLRNRSLVSLERLKTVETIFGSNTHPETLRFIRFLNDRGRLYLLLDICSDFLEKVAFNRGLLEGELISSRKLDITFVEKLTKKLSDSNGKKVMLNLSVDEELIGGFKLRLGDIVYDYSIAGQLALVEKELSEKY